MNCPDPGFEAVGACGPAPPPDVTCDAFLNDRFRLFQPRKGFRSGWDALLLAACVADDSAGRGVDLGAGTGAAAFAAAVRAPALHVVLVERDAQAAALARASIASPRNRDVANRLAVVEADLLAARPVREAAGLADGTFDVVLTNPPFHPFGSRMSPDPARRAAKAMHSPHVLQRWIVVAAALLRRGGRLLMVGRPENLSDILQAAENRLGGVTVLPVHSGPDRAASRILVSAVRGSRAPVRLLPSAYVADAAGRTTSMAAEVAGGTHHFAALVAG